jgi:hypothetical protein
MTTKTKTKTAQAPKEPVLFEIRAVDYSHGRVGRDPLAESDCVSTHNTQEEAEEYRARPGLRKQAILSGRLQRAERGLHAELEICERLLAEPPFKIDDAELAAELERETGGLVPTNVTRRLGEPGWTQLACYG